MSDLKVPLIEAVIGSPFAEGETEQGIILTDAQATALENRLSENDKAIATAATAATASATKTTELTASNTAVTTAIQAALTTAEVEGADKMSNEEGITALSALVAEYGAADGAKPSTTLDGPQNADDDNPNVIEGMDISADMNY